MRLTRAMIYVKDLPAMAVFYGDVLGLVPVVEGRSDSWMEFEAGNTRLALHAIPPHIAEQIEISSPPVPREETPIKLFFAVDDVASECARLKALGVPVELRPWGAADGIDPEGNIFQIC